MSKQGAVKDYKFGQKNNWRRWAWNELARRVRNPRTALVLYLAGMDDLDRVVATDKGFRNQNLIAVSHDQDVVDSVRSRGHIAICGNINDLLYAWPDAYPVDAVLADFCAGMSAHLRDFSRALSYRPGPPGHVLAVVINAMRGREQGIATTIIDDWKAEVAKVERGFRWANGVPIEDAEKNRALLFINRAVAYECALLENPHGCGGMEKLGRGWVRMEPALPIETLNRWFQRLGSTLQATGKSYKSGNLVFDSSAFNWVAGRYSCTSAPSGDVISDYRAARRSIAAALAVRTRRLSA